MSEEDRAREQLLEELDALRRRVAELEAAERELGRMRSALERGAESLQKLLDGSVDVTVMLDGEGTVRYVSSSVERIMGYRPEEILGKNVFHFIHPDDVHQLVEDFQGGRGDAVPTRKGEFRYRHRDVTWRFMETTGMNFLDDLLVAGVFATGRDITDRKRMERSLRESEERYRALIESQAVGISEVDREERFIFANLAAHDIFGVPRGELVGRSLAEFTDAENFALIRKQTEIRRTGRESTYDVEIVRPDGERRTLRITATPRMDAEGRLVAAMGVFSDITERKKAEEAVQQRERYYRSLIRNAADMITILNEDFAFRWGSRAAGRITGYSPDEIYGRSVLDFIHPEDLEEAREVLEFVLQNPGIPRHIERRFRHRDGTYHYHEAILNNLLDDPSVRGIILNSRDITERKMMEEQLLASVRELDAFATTISHDLRAPLSLIEGYVQLLQAEGVSSRERDVYLQNIAHAARRMDELTESLLAYAKAGLPGGELTSVWPLEVIREVLLDHSEEISRQGVEIVLDDDFPPIRADPLKLRQVYSNLLDNAIKYMGGTPLPRVQMGAEKAGGVVTLYVRDNGRGIDPRREEEIFLPFKRFDVPETPGLGIGLSTVKRAVEGWGGKVWVDSKPGEGASFYFTAPAG